MKPVTKFMANDGSLWDSPEEAMSRDDLLVAVAQAMRPLGDRPDDEGCEFSNGHGHRQHQREAVMRAKAALIDLTRPHLASWMYDQEHKHGKNLMTIHPSWFGCMLDGECPPLEHAWSRLWCIDAQGREWGQPYYAEHPEKAQEQRPI